MHDYNLCQHSAQTHKSFVDRREVQMSRGNYTDTTDQRNAHHNKANQRNESPKEAENSIDKAAIFFLFRMGYQHCNCV